MSNRNGRVPHQNGLFRQSSQTKIPLPPASRRVRLAASLLPNDRVPSIWQCIRFPARGTVFRSDGEGVLSGFSLSRPACSYLKATDFQDATVTLDVSAKVKIIEHFSDRAARGNEKEGFLLAAKNNVVVVEQPTPPRAKARINDFSGLPRSQCIKATVVSEASFVGGSREKAIPQPPVSPGHRVASIEANRIAESWGGGGGAGLLDATPPRYPCRN
jgi:hypothetical protein